MGRRRRYWRDSEGHWAEIFPFDEQISDPAVDVGDGILEDDYSEESMP